MKNIMLKYFAATIAAVVIGLSSMNIVYAAEMEASEASVEISAEDAAYGYVFCEAAFELINEQRAAYGLDALEWDVEALGYGTAVRVLEQEQLFSHTRPDGSDWWTADAENLYGEILGRGYWTPEAIVTAWMNSDGHRAVILNENYSSICVAYYITPSGQIYWAAEFNY